MSLFNNKEEMPSFGNKQPRSDWLLNLRIFVWETLKVVIISLAIIIPVRYFLIQPFYVQGASMEPNFYDREYLIVDEISYRFSEPGRGDIVVFRYPRDPKQFFIKRIIGLPGEQIEINNGKVSIISDAHPDGLILDESGYLPKSISTSGNLRISLSVDEYYLLGDNRSSSLDSRGFGPITRQLIVGKVWLRGWPINRVGSFEEPEYNL